MPEVDAFGTLHVDHLSKVTDELDEFADDADVLLVEGPREKPDKVIRNYTILDSKFGKGWNQTQNQSLTIG